MQIRNFMSVCPKKAVIMDILGAFDVKLSDNPKVMDSFYVLDHWKRLDVKTRVPKDICALIHLYFYCGDEWIAFGKHLHIANDCNNAKLECMDTFSNTSTRGSGYGLTIVEPPANDSITSRYYWKLQMGATHSWSYAIGFARECDGIIDANTWYIKNKYSVGIYCDGEVWTQGAILHNKGIGWKENDIINLCLDYNSKCVYVQRCQLISNDGNTDSRITETEITKNYNIHKARRVFNGIDSKSNYRLCCYLRALDHTVEIIKFSEQAFKEWDIDTDSDQRNQEDKAVIIMYNGVLLEDLD
eukprot:225910_1